MSLLKIEGLVARHGLLTAVQGISLDIEQGETLALVGANGAGKTTLLRTLAGVHPVTGGRIVFDGVDVSALPAHHRVMAGLALVPEGRKLFPAMTVQENLLVALSAKREGNWNLGTVLEAFPQLKPKLKAAAGTLSGGQQQAVAIGRALMTNPRVLLLDEVSLGLSPLAVQGVYDSLNTLMGKGTAHGTTVVLVEQDLQRTFQVADRIVCMLEGKVVAIGRSDEMTREQVMAYYFGHRTPTSSLTSQPTGTT
ncbi:ABC transporter ATP-binding protein [Limnohabitans sp. TS-CS-82]|uniref:ABC transporter ATP-binding protein n=1 Tax=Limnohabitans sp. TS-CS-82 TaxID=2094193 RepID=UPI000CF2B536|nr:ABC transporter ATP-binding protein [Limnohabitans sp. TS-CS-82]PQA80500.1 ABC transporter ATP-binding protein [Limnohabitans sp. TS-CS-82]